MNITVINNSSRSLPYELLSAVSDWKDFDVLNDIAEQYNLKIKKVKFIYDDEDRPIEQEITFGDI